MQLACKAMCKMLMGIESGHEQLVVMQKEVANVCEAMLALPMRLPWTRFYKGLQVIIQIIMSGPLPDLISLDFYYMKHVRCHFLWHMLIMDL